MRIVKYFTDINKKSEKHNGKYIIKSTYRKIILVYNVVYLIMSTLSLFITEEGYFLKNLLLSIFSISIILLSFVKKKTTDIILLILLIVFAFALFFV